MTKIPNSDAAIMPPKTGVPTARRVIAPAPSRNDERQQAQDEGEARHHDRAKSEARGFDGRGFDILAAPALLDRESDDQDAVLGGERDQHDEPDLRIDVEARSRRALSAIIAPSSATLTESSTGTGIFQLS